MKSSRMSGWSVRKSVLICLTLAAVAGAGCTRSGGRAEISGKVAFKKGDPIKRGSIEFSPLEGGKIHGGARITDGVYSIPKEKGLKAGKYLVRISAPSGLLSANGAPGGGGPGKLPEEIVSPKYNTDSQLNVEVGSDKKQEFDFVVE